MRRFLAATVATGVAGAACAIGAAIVTGALAAGLITDPSARSLAHCAPALAVLAGLWAARAALAWLQARLGQRSAAAVIAELSGRVLAAVTDRAPRDLDGARDAAALVATRGLDGLLPYFTAYLPTLVLAGVLTPATVAVIGYYDLKSAVIVVVTLPLIPLFMALIGLATAERSAAALAAMATLQARLLDLIAGIPTLRALGRAAGPERRVAALADAHRRSAIATLRIAFLSALVLELLAMLGVAVVAVSIGLRLVYGKLGLTAGLTVLLLAPEAYWPLRRVGAEFHAAEDGRAAADAAFALLDDSPAPPGGSRPVAAAGITIELSQLSVAGRDGCAPDRLDALLSPGTVTVLTGPNGAGKSTALQAITGLLTPTAGTVRVDGVDVAELDRHTWWSRLGWLPQRPALIPDTITANLNLFGELADPAQACADAGFDTVVATLPAGLDTVLGRGGVGLSLGQRQRLGLARVLGGGAPVLLLDEPTAHLDADTERRVLAAIVARARAGATVLVIGHHPAVLAIGDRIVEAGAAHAAV